MDTSIRWWRVFTLGVVAGLLLAPTSGRTLRRLLRDGLAHGLDRLLRTGLPPEQEMLRRKAVD